MYLLNQTELYIMTSEEMKRRTKKFAVDVGKFILQLYYNVVNKAYSNQLIRSSSSVAANYRVVRRAKSTADFINKLKIVEEEADESLFFLEMLYEFNIDKRMIITVLMKEAEELLKIVVASINAVKNRTSHI